MIWPTASISATTIYGERRGDESPCQNVGSCPATKYLSRLYWLHGTLCLYIKFHNVESSLYRVEFNQNIDYQRTVSMMWRKDNDCWLSSNDFKDLLLFKKDKSCVEIKFFRKQDVIIDVKCNQIDYSNYNGMSHYILDSERSDKCIDFTMIITSRNNASISNFGGGFRWKSEYPFCIIQEKIVLKVIKKNPKSLVTPFFYECLKFEVIRNMSKLRKFASNFVVGKSITSRNNASISNFGGGFRWKSEYPFWIILTDKSSPFRIVFRTQ
ncbi:hypothetical protein AGLY_013979 [Aphis glycines]|uniref:Uncharacterized protein n=1 Tax=Aphis glycines TaxID=307491 RepID=A0A6G0T4S4_APHGL|nr:hypothetical protein AGLY_013979 [Aphis glycines]